MKSVCIWNVILAQNEIIVDGDYVVGLHPRKHVTLELSGEPEQDISSPDVKERSQVK